MAKSITIFLKLSDWSQEMLAAFTRLMAAVEHADQALLEDEIRDAHAELRSVLRRGE